MGPDTFRVMGCRPVIPNAAERAVELEMGRSIATPYEGSVKMLCEGGCLREIWVGPKQQATLEEFGKENFLIACLPCAAMKAAEIQKQDPQDFGIDVYHLGGVHPDD